MVLRVLVVGGGLAGLATALSLRRAGHQVEVFEESQLSFEDTAGPVVHLGPKTNEFLRQLGISTTSEARAVPVNEVKLPTIRNPMVDFTDIASKVTEFSSDGTLITEGNSQPPGWEYYQRSRLHQALLNSATASSGLGQPVAMHLGAKALSVDADIATVTLSSGEIIQGDVVVGSDGFDSTVRKHVFGSNIVSSCPVTVAVHFSVNMRQFGNSSINQRFQCQPQRYEKWLGAANLEIKVYSFESGDIVFDCNIPVQEHSELNPGSLKERILKAFEAGHSELLQLLAAVDLKDIHFWTRNILPFVENWTYKSVVLVGDAAHPFLPHELPGTAQAFNDALALGTQLSSDISAEKVQECLLAWEKPRKDRARTIQKAERASWPSTQLF